MFDPNSDGVLLRRTRAASRSAVTTTASMRPPPSSSDFQVHASSSGRFLELDGDEPDGTKSIQDHDQRNKPVRGQMTSLVAVRRSVSVADPPFAGTNAIPPPPLPPPPTAATNPKKKRIRIQSEQRREQCRRNQARYRNKQQSVEMDLQIAVERLRLQVLQLQEQRRALYVSINTRDSATRVAIEYFRLFRYGLQPSHSSVPHASRQRTHAQTVPPVETQLAFVTFAFHDNMRVDDAYGRDLFVEQSRRFATFYDDAFIELTSSLNWSACETSTKLHTTERLELTVSPTTIRQVFPHLLLPQYAAIRNKLLGKRLKCIVNSMFVFDMHGKVVQLDWNIDFAMALQKMLHIHETVDVLQQAHIVRDGYLLEADNENVAIRNSDTNLFEAPDPRSRWYEKRRWSEAEPTPHRSLRELHTETDDDYNDDVLIHDGKGDDYVMV